MTSLPLPDSALPPIVAPEEWAAAHEAMLVEEKAFTRARDALAARRRRMPMTPVETDYRFVGPEGEVGLLDLFDGRRQLVVYRFFYQSDVDGWPDKGCPGCSYLADHVPYLDHLHALGHDLRDGLARRPGEDRRPAAAQRLGPRPLVHAGRRRLRPRLRCRRDVRPQRVPPRRPRPGVPHVLRQRPRRRVRPPHAGRCSTSPRSAGRRPGRTRPEGRPQLPPYRAQRRGEYS